MILKLYLISLLNILDEGVRENREVKASLSGYRNEMTVLLTN